MADVPTDSGRPTFPSNRPAWADLVYAPPSYPSHDYTGMGIVVPIYVGGDFVGYLSRKGDAVGWAATAPPDTPEGVVRILVNNALMAGAANDVPLDETWEAILQANEYGQRQERDLSTIWPEVSPHLPTR